MLRYLSNQTEPKQTQPDRWKCTCPLLLGITCGHLCKPLAPTERTGGPAPQQWSCVESGKWPFVIYLTLLKSIPLVCSLISHAALNAAIQPSLPTCQSPAKVQIAYGKWSWIARTETEAQAEAAYVSLPLLFEQLFCSRTFFAIFFAVFQLLW